MKTLLILGALVFSSALASAQAVDPFVQAAVDAAMPQQYAGYTSLALIALMWLGRAIPVLQQGSGIVGWFKAILFGTNTPKLLIACLCLLSLPSCTVLESRAGMSGIDLFMITAKAANRAKADFDFTSTEVAAAKIRYASRRPATSAKEPRDVNP
jgi:hypothetical protein